MKLEKRYNFVCFKIADIDDDPEDPQANRVTLKLSQDWKETAGIKPDANVATCNWFEFDKLQKFVPPTFVGGNTPTVPADKPNQLHREGSIEFYYSNPDTPDVVLENITSIRIEPRENGTTQVEQGGEKIQVNRAVIYELWFADFRYKLQPPRRGRLLLGDVNSSKDNVEDFLSNSDLIQACLDALHLSGVTIPDEVDDIDPMRDLSWNGAHPLEELEKILDYVGCVFIPSSDPTKMLQTINAGDVPDIAPADLINEVQVEQFDGKPKVVVITSAPQPVIDSYDGSDSTRFQFEFVARDLRGQWRALADIPEIGDSPISHFRTDFANVPQDDFRLRLLSEVYRFIRLKGSTARSIGGAPILRRRLSPDSGALADVHVLAQVAVPAGPNGSWKKSSHHLAIDAPWLIAGNILGLSLRLVDLSVNTPTNDLEGNAVEVNDFAVVGDVEAWSDDAKHKLFFNVGFSQQFTGESESGDGLVRLENPIVDAFMDGVSNGGLDETSAEIFKDAIVLHMPELRYIRPNGQDDDDARDALIAKARDRAARFLAGSDQPVKTKACRGFVPGELSGQVTEIIRSQEKVTTTFGFNKWKVPGFFTLQKARREGGRGASASLQQSSQPARTYFGSGGEVQCTAPIIPPRLEIASQKIQQFAFLYNIAARPGSYRAILVQPKGDALVYDESDASKGPSLPWSAFNAQQLFVPVIGQDKDIPLDILDPEYQWGDPGFVSYVHLTVNNLFEQGYRRHRLYCGSVIGLNNVIGGFGSDPVIWPVDLLPGVVDKNGNAVGVINAHPSREEVFGRIVDVQPLAGGLALDFMGDDDPSPVVRWAYMWEAVVWDEDKAAWVQEPYGELTGFPVDDIIYERFALNLNELSNQQAVAPTGAQTSFFGNGVDSKYLNTGAFDSSGNYTGEGSFLLSNAAQGSSGDPFQDGPGDGISCQNKIYRIHRTLHQRTVDYGDPIGVQLSQFARFWIQVENGIHGACNT